MPATVHPISDATALHDKAIIAELRAQLAEAREQRDAWREIAARTAELLNVEQRYEARQFCPSPQGHHVGTRR
jgi:hypothetical protein